MSRAVFEKKTGLSLLDGEGDLKPSDAMPPMNTFLNRLLALRIGDQNALFAAFDQILSSILERAAQSGALDRGMEDIVADDLAILDEEVVRSDAVTGAETKLLRFQVRTRRELTTVEGALTGLDPQALTFAVNGKSGRAALIVHGLTTTDDNDRLIPAVRLVRPERRSVTSVKSFEESAWDAVDETTWRKAWKRELAETDPWVTRELVLVSGLLLPIWSSLPDKGASVRRLKAPDGRRWLGRLLEPGQVPPLKVALGLTDLATAMGDADHASASILEQGSAIGIAGGLWLRRARVMDRYRIEVVGAGAQRQAFVALGCFTEIIAYAPRVFVPVDKPGVLRAVLTKWPAQSVLPKAA